MGKGKGEGKEKMTLASLLTFPSNLTLFLLLKAAGCRVAPYISGCSLDHVEERPVRPYGGVGVTLYFRVRPNVMKIVAERFRASTSSESGFAARSAPCRDGPQLHAVDPSEFASFKSNLDFLW